MNFTNAQIFIRMNQIGYGKLDFKSAVVMSQKPLSVEKFVVKSLISKTEVLTGYCKKEKTKYGSFDYCYSIDFTNLNKSGLYIIEVSGEKSYPFEISGMQYGNIVRDLLKFFKIQRCGYTDPFMHQVCHIADATGTIENGIRTDKKIDVTGGWHDAGDYIKFLNTTAYATYMLLFSYEFNPDAFNTDFNKNNVPDILDEAKVGLDWLLRCNVNNEKLVTQVQDLSDQSVGWRLPEKDTLRFNRPAFIGIGKNLVGIYTAALALGAKIWLDKLNYPEFSQKCLSTAEIFYSKLNLFPNISKEGTGVYIDQNYKGKVALGAIELYRVTKNQKYLENAKKTATEAGSDFWWSYGNINSLAHYRLSYYDKKYSDYILKNLQVFDKNKNSRLFNEGTVYSWGTNNTFLGISLQVILWKQLTGSKMYDNLAVLQRDFTLGRNPWGISFFYGYGMNHTQKFHHQIAWKNDGRLPGGFAAGPVLKSFLDGYKINFEHSDRLKLFQSDSAYYRDDRMDYISNEPTITAAATAIFVMGYFNKNR